MSKVIYFNINYRCNLNCSFCFSNSTSSSGRELPVKTICKVLNYVSPDNNDLIVLNGGEPTLHSHFYSILGIIQAKYSSAIVIYTNGTVIKASEIPQSDKINFIIPIHGFQELHDSITRISGSFENTIKNIKLLQENGSRYKIKFILNNQMILSNFNIINFLIQNNLLPCEIILARLNETSKSRLNHVILPSKDDLKTYLDLQIKLLKDYFAIKFLDIPFCFLTISNSNGKLLSEEVPEFFFGDINNQLQSRKYYKEIMIGSDCNNCHFQEKCLIMKHSYLTLILRNNKLKIERE